MKTMSMVSFMLIFLIGISISMLTYQSNSHQQIFAQSSMTNMEEEEKLSVKKYNNNNNFIIEISTEEGTDVDDGLSNQDLCNKYLEQEGCEIGGSTTITTEQNVTQRLEEKLLEGRPESIPAPSPPPTPTPSPPSIPFESFTNDSFSISDTQLALNSTGQFSNGSMGNISQ
jgi:hypothetical protein